MRPIWIFLISLCLLSGLALPVYSETDVFKLAHENKWNDVISIIKKNEVDANLTDAQGRTLLMICSALNYPGIIDQLLSLGSKIDAEDTAGQRSVHYAVKEGQYEQLARLIKAGAIISGAEAGEFIDFALSWDDYNTALVLLASGFIPVSDIGNKSGILLIAAAEKPLLSAVIKLIEMGYNVNVQDKNSMTALMHAAQHGHAVLVKQLIASGAKVDIQDERGRTALAYAVQASVSKAADFKDPISIILDGPFMPDFKHVIKELREAGAKATHEITVNLIDKEDGKNIWNYYLRSQLYYWEILLYYLGILLAMILMFGQFDKTVDGSVILISIIVGFFTTIGLIGNHMPELQFALTTTGAGRVFFASLRGLVVTALAMSLIYLLWQLFDTTTDKNHCVIVDDDLCCPECGKPLTLVNKKKGFCPFCKKRFCD